MNRLNRSILAVAVAGGLTIGGMGIVRNALADRPAAVALDKDHQFPHLYNALVHLRAVREELNNADASYGKYRDAAIDATDKARRIVEDAYHAAGGKDIALPPAAIKLDEPVKLHGHMHKALSELHDAAKEVDDVEVVFQRDKRKDAMDQIEVAIHQIREGLIAAEK